MRGNIIMDNIRIDTYDIWKLVAINSDSYKGLKQTIESLSKGLLSSITESNLSALNQLSETMKEGLDKLGNIHTKYDYSVASKNMANGLSQLANNNLVYNTDAIRNSISNMIEALSGLQTEQLKQITNFDYSKAFSSALYSTDSLREIINIAYTASQECANESDVQKTEDDLLTAEEAIETICEHISNFSDFIERISTWSQEKIKKFWILFALANILWDIFILPFLQENIGKPAMATFTCNVKELPEKEATIICQLKENVEAYITENANYYYKVSFTDEDGIKHEGYVAKRNLKIVQQEETEKNDKKTSSQEEQLPDIP